MCPIINDAKDGYIYIAQNGEPDQMGANELKS